MFPPHSPLRTDEETLFVTDIPSSNAACQLSTETHTGMCMLCVRVCVCVYIYIYTCTHTHTHVCVCARTHTHVGGYASMRARRQITSLPKFDMRQLNSLKEICRL